jgi:hypothetical protein
MHKKAQFHNQGSLSFERSMIVAMQNEDNSRLDTCNLLE